jgi:hypothetical protein
MDEIHLRILRVTEDLRAIQRELNCRHAGPQRSRTHGSAFRSARDGIAERLEIRPRPDAPFPLVLYASHDKRLRNGREAAPEPAPRPAHDSPEAEKQHIQNASDAIMLRYLADSKFRKPNCAAEQKFDNRQAPIRRTIASRGCLWGRP